MVLPEAEHRLSFHLFLPSNSSSLLQNNLSKMQICSYYISVFKSSRVLIFHCIFSLHFIFKQCQIFGHNLHNTLLFTYFSPSWSGLLGKTCFFFFFPVSGIPIPSSGTDPERHWCWDFCCIQEDGGIAMSICGADQGTAWPQVLEELWIGADVVSVFRELWK